MRLLQNQRNIVILRESKYKLPDKIRIKNYKSIILMFIVLFKDTLFFGDALQVAVNEESKNKIITKFEENFRFWDSLIPIIVLNQALNLKARLRKPI